MARKPLRGLRPLPFLGQPERPVLSRATILDNGLIGKKNQNKRSLEGAREVPDPRATEDNLYALNTLQLRRGWPLEELSVQIPMEYLCDKLPPACQKMVGIARVGPLYVFNCDERDLERRIGKMFGTWREFWNVFRKTEFIFWPIEADKGYFVTAIFHMEKAMIDDPDFDPDADPDAAIPQVESRDFAIVGTWSVVDGQRGDAGQKRLRRVRERVELILAAHGIRFGEGSFMVHRGANGEEWNEPWVPPHDDDEAWSTGIRSFAIVRQMIQRVLDLYCYQGEYDDGLFREPCCGWINVDQVRYEMMGICAVNVMEDMKWNARLAVECIQEITCVEGLPPFKANLLAPYDNDKKA
ncbi:hypothetical protein F5X98DRAFT_378873 [Xylaria grammica]|nr:hypothetical protein F5X98DRAFT_378873 [Xylaria grammica]